jgi:hypothetical protein
MNDDEVTIETIGEQNQAFQELFSMNRYFAL